MTLRKRLYLDIFMSALLAFEMFFELTGDTLHEIVGLVFFLTILAHLALSAKWAKSMSRAIGKGTMTKKATSHVVLAILLLVSVAPLAVSSAAISHIIAGTGADLTMAIPYATWVTVHNIAAYTTCVLTVVHLAMHWQSFAKAFSVPYNPQRRRAIGTAVGATAALGAIALGFAGMGAVNAFGLGNPAQSATDESNEGNDRLTVNDSQPPEETEEEVVEKASPVTESYESSGSESYESEPEPEPEPPSSSTSSSTAVTGNCTLCKKRCPLSNPGCNKPYEAGLI